MKSKSKHSDAAMDKKLIKSELTKFAAKDRKADMKMIKKAQRRK